MPHPESGPPAPRKIIHIDMDAFFASVEQRDNPVLRGKPIAVGHGAARGVVAAASYEARPFGVRSAMPSVTAIRRCPDLIFVPPRFEVYRQISQQIRAIFADYTALIEPLSLDEAYLDVTEDALKRGSARAIAEAIRARIKAETGLTASAGVSYNKFIAKLASDHNKPDGLCVIPPAKGPAFVAALPVRRFHGVGPVTAARMERLGIFTGAELRDRPLAFLQAHFGSFAAYLHQAARGEDHRPVRSHRQRKSIGAERTLDRDVTDPAVLRANLDRIIDAAWTRIESSGARGRTVTLKLKFADFRQITRAHSLPDSVESRAHLLAIAQKLLQAELPTPQAIRLMGIILSTIGEESAATAPLLPLALA